MAAKKIIKEASKGFKRMEFFALRVLYDERCLVVPGVSAVKG
jgi:hypothetical protein